MSYICNLIQLELKVSYATMPYPINETVGN